MQKYVHYRHHRSQMVHIKTIISNGCVIRTNLLSIENNDINLDLTTQRPIEIINNKSIFVPIEIKVICAYHLISAEYY